MGQGNSGLCIWNCKSAVLVYKGGERINGQQPDFQFDDPYWSGASTYGTNIVTLENFTGLGYPSILITDPDGYYDGGYENGGVFLFNIGKGLSDTCRGYFDDAYNQNEFLGETAICAGDILNNGRTAAMIGSQTDNFNILHRAGVGSLNVLLGDPSYGYPVTGVYEPPSAPTIFELEQNFPNPFSSSSQIIFDVVEPNLYGKELLLKLSDIRGKPVATLYKGIADAAKHTITVDGSALPNGNYFYELSCNNWHLRKTMAIVK